MPAMSKSAKVIGDSRDREREREERREETREQRKEERYLIKDLVIGVRIDDFNNRGLSLRTKSKIRIKFASRAVVKVIYQCEEWRNECGCRQNQIEME